MNTRTQLRSFCYFCGEHTAVVNGTLADHGFRVPGFGHRTSGCPGSHCRPVEQSTAQIEKSIRLNEKCISGKAELIEAIKKAGLKPYEMTAAIAKAERNADMAAINIETDRKALAQWTAKELIEVDLVIEAETKKSEVQNTRRASLEAKLAKVPARKERAYKNFQTALKNWASGPDEAVNARMRVSCLHDYEYNLGCIQREESEWNTKLSFMK